MLISPEKIFEFLCLEITLNCLVGPRGSKLPLVYPFPVSARHKSSSSSRLFLETSLRSERLCINYGRNFSNLLKVSLSTSTMTQSSKVSIIHDLLKVSKLTIIFDLLKVFKMNSLRLFISLEVLRTSNMKTRYTSFKGFHRTLHRNLYNPSYSYVLQLSRKYAVWIGVHRAPLQRCQWRHNRVNMRPSYESFRNIHAIKDLRSFMQTLQSSSVSCL